MGIAPGFSASQNKANQSRFPGGVAVLRASDGMKYNRGCCAPCHSRADGNSGKPGLSWTPASAGVAEGAVPVPRVGNHGGLPLREEGL